MDRAAISELFDYTGWAWERIEHVIDGLPAQQFGDPAPGSGWPALSDCVEHFTSAYDGWIHGAWALGLGPTLYPRGGEDFPGTWELRDWETMKHYRRNCRDAFQAAMDVPDEELFEKRRWELDEGIPEMLSRADILMNLLLHERGHHGDLNTLFHQLGVRSYIIDYRYFVSRQDEFATDDEE